MDFWQLIEKRRSTRSFLNKKIEEEKLDKILEAINRAPSARNLQSYKVFVIKDSEEKKQLRQACRDQEFISQADICLVFVSWVENTEIISERTEFFAQLDATIACYQGWLAGVELGLAGVWIGAYNEEEIAKMLDLKFGQRPVAVLPLGYTDSTPDLKARKKLADLIIEK